MKSFLLIPLAWLAFAGTACAQTQPEKHDDVILRHPPCFICFTHPHRSPSVHLAAPAPTFGPKDYADVLVPPPPPASHPQHPELP